VSAVDKGFTSGSTINFYGFPDLVYPGNWTDAVGTQANGGNRHAHEFVGETWVMAGGADTHHRRWQQAKEDTSAK
jgi:hypothetical protein